MENLFLICLIPPVSIEEDIDVIRTEISEAFKVLESLKRPAHITLYNPVKISSLEQEQHFFKTLEEACFSTPFKQVLHNFNAFAPHTVYIGVEQNPGIMNLQIGIRKALQPLKLLPEKDGFKFTPHLTIAFKDVTATVFPLIMEHLKDRKFKRSFEVDRFYVYKHSDKRWRPYREFEFRPPESKPRPLSLFDNF